MRPEAGEHVSGEERRAPPLDLPDVGLFVVYTSSRRGDDPITGDVTSAPGFPPIDVLIDRYTRRTGIDVSALDWYVGLACFKLAVVLEGIYFRWIHTYRYGRNWREEKS